MNYKIKLFIYFATVFTLFTVGVVVYAQWRDKHYKQELLLNKLDIYARFVQHNLHDTALPSDLRITLIEHNGRVTYENLADSSQKFSNHFLRPEIQLAKAKGTGWNIRVSQTTDKEYLYYALKTDNGYIRVALPFTTQTAHLLSADQNFLIFAFILFVVALVFLWILAGRFGDSMMRMDRDVASSRNQGEKLKTEMTSSIAHELRTPIAAIRGYTETLLDGDLPKEKQTQFLERTHNAALRLSDLIRDISLLSKLDENRRGFDAEPINVSNVVSGVIADLAPMIKENSITIDNRLPKEVKIEGNQTLIQSIFVNLIENSIKYGGKWITVGIELTGNRAGRVSFRIWDTGVGIEEEHLERIFERFYRVDRGRTRSDGGSGLGLSIVRHAVIYHGGQISAQRASDGGLVVNFDLKTTNSGKKE